MLARFLAITGGFLLLLILGSSWAPALGATDRSLAIQDVTIKVNGRAMAGRVYREPTTEKRAGLVLLPGLHRQGIDDPRLNKFARLLARERFVVLTPETAGSRNLRLDQQSLFDSIAAFEYLSELPEVDPKRVGFWGICMAGPVAVQAASYPRLADRVAFVVSLEGYYKLEGALRFLLSGEYTEAGAPRYLRPNRYARAVALANYINGVYRGADKSIVLEGIDLLLVGRDAAAAALQSKLSPAGQQVLDLITITAPPAKTALARPAQRIYRELITAMRARIPLLLKPPDLARLQCRVFIVHTESSDFFPPTEGKELHADLLKAGKPSTLVATNLFNHVTPQAGAEQVDMAATAADLLRLAAFLSQVRAYAR